MPLSLFHPVIADWFRARFGEPTEVQAASWPAIRSGTHALIAAPTGSGKTLAAFLTCIDDLFKRALAGEMEDTIHVLYVSPLKALSNDIQKNLQDPLTAITDHAICHGVSAPDLRVDVRTGDTPQSVRQQQLRRPPHILVTTPESLYLLLTAHKSRALLQRVRTVIVDEIHAIASTKRGSHLALSLARLEALCTHPPVRIGLSATQRPLEEIARFLIGGNRTHPDQTMHQDSASGNCRLVDIGQHRTMELHVEVPRDELGAVGTNAVWSDMYDRLAELAHRHRSTLVFVNTRRLAERVAHHLGERLGEDRVASHHGSLSCKLRLSAEERLKRGDTRLLVATASLELGIDIGHVDLVCQIGSPRAISTCIQRIGRAGHWIGAIPHGRLFCTTRDELVECAALVRAIRAGCLDPVTVPMAPFDILAQQIVAEVSAQEWAIEDLYALVTRAHPYRRLSYQQFEQVIRMLADGYVPGRRQHAHIVYDRYRGRLRARRGARLVALTSGGAIPDTAAYTVVAEPEGTIVGTVDEDFAVESLAGDIILLGTSSWRIRSVATGTMYVEDAHGASPTIPFWRGEAPARTAELSAAIAQLREEVGRRLDQDDPAARSETRAWLIDTCGLDAGGADQLIAYLATGKQQLRTVPTQARVVAERFFDESGGMQLVMHAPFGGRINRAWGLALRKRFCMNFDFELQAAATDDGLVLSLGERHSFPLDAVFTFLRSQAAREVVSQAVLGSPLFVTRWRWTIARALALQRFQRGRKVPFHIQRMRAEDMLAAVFPLATACQDNHVGDRPIPDHPLVQETMRECLSEAMDLDGLIDVLRGIESGRIATVAVESPTPSVFSHEILNANPYAFLDDAPLEERRARAVNLRRMLPDTGDRLGALDETAVATAIEEAWPSVRDADELYEALSLLVWVPGHVPKATGWNEYLPSLIDAGRATIIAVGLPHAREVRGWTLTEYVPILRQIFPRLEIVSESPGALPACPAIEHQPEPADGLASIVRGWMEVCGPITASELAMTLHLPAASLRSALLRLEQEGVVLHGQFRPQPQDFIATQPRTDPRSAPPREEEWCHRRLLARIHQRTVVALRREIEPVSAADFMRFLFRWQHRAPGSQLHGEVGLRTIIEQLSGFEAPASSWERAVFKERIAGYTPEWLDQLCLRGEVAWGRLTWPESAIAQQASFLTHGPRPSRDDKAIPRRAVTPTSAAPLSFMIREDLVWLVSLARRGTRGTIESSPPHLSTVAMDVFQYLSAHGASFFGDVKAGTGHLASQIETALWELVAAGLVTADGFDNLRALLDPRRRRAEGNDRRRRPRHSPGRWTVLPCVSAHRATSEQDHHQSIERWAKQLLTRYGIVFRDLIAREALARPWRELLVEYRRLEWRGEIRGGRFVRGVTGEQFALPEAVEALRAVRRDPQLGAQEILLSPADPLNLIGILLPGNRVSPYTSTPLCFRNGVPITEIPSCVSQSA